MKKAEAIDDVQVLRRRYGRERQARRQAEAIAERATREYYETSQRLIQAQAIAHIGFWEWDSRDGRSAWSDELFRILGMDPPDPSAPHPEFIDHVHPEDRERVGRILEAARQSARPFDIEHRVVRPGGAVRVVRFRGKVQRNSVDQPVHLVATAHDITEWREAEAARAAAEERAKEVDQLHQLNQFKTHFINTAAHELLTPLTPMRAILHVLSDDPGKLSEENLRKSVHMLVRNLERLTRLVGDLLDASRLEAQKLGLRKHRRDLSGLARDAVEFFRSEAERKGIRIDTALQPDLHVEFDADRFNQVVYNLLSNALKFTPQGGTVTVETRRDGYGGALLRVADSGMGIPPEFRSRIFQPFSRAHLELDQIQPGAGLGLFITKGLVELHGGMIRCESPGSGQGTAFTVILPG